MALLSLLGLVPLLWFREGYNALAGFDFSVYLNPVDTMTRSLYLWSDRMAGGYDISHEISSFAYYLVFSLPILLGASLYTAEKFVFCLLFALQGVSMYYMLSAFFDAHPSRRFISFTGALLYAFSYPVMAHFGRGNLMAILSYAMLPLLLGFLHRGFEAGNTEGRYILAIALLSFPLSSTKGHPADFLVITGVAFSFAAFHALSSKKEKALRVASFSMKALFASIAVNLWWLFPNVFYMADFGLGRPEMLKEGFYNLDLLKYYSSGTSVLNVLRNERLDLWFDFPGDPLFNPAIYSTPLFIIVGLLMPAAASLALVRKRVEKNTVFLSLIAVSSVFLSKGSHEPYGGVFEHLYLNVPGFFFFRAPYRVFSSLLTFSITPLIAVTLSLLAGMLSGSGTRKEGIYDEVCAQNPLNKDDADGEYAPENPGDASAGKSWTSPFLLTPMNFKNISLGLVISFFLISSLLYSWPIFTGAHLREKGTARVPGVFHNIPQAYYGAGEWLKERGEGFKLYYPYEIYDSNTAWGYNGPDPSFETITAPKVAARPGGTVYVRYQRPIESLNKVVREWNYGDLKKVLGVYNSRYVLVHKDINPWTLPDYNFNAYMESLLETNGMRRVYDNGQFSFYENEEWPGRVSFANKAYILSGTEEALPALSLTGRLSNPFLLMARDINGGSVGFEDILSSVDGVIFHDSNATDLVCDILEKSPGISFEGASIEFDAPDGGPYYVFIKDAPQGEHPDALDGVRWRKAAELRLKSGYNRIEAGVGEGEEGHRGEYRRLIVLKEKFLSERNALLERMKEPGFEVSYIMTPTAAAKNPAIDLPGNESYSLRSMRPRQFKRRTVDALSYGAGGAGGGGVSRDRAPSGWSVSSGDGKWSASDSGSFRFSPWPGLRRDSVAKISKEIEGAQIGSFRRLYIYRGAFSGGKGAKGNKEGAVKPPQVSISAKIHLTAEGKDAWVETLEVKDSDIPLDGSSIDLLEMAERTIGGGERFLAKRIDVEIAFKSALSGQSGGPANYLYSIRAPSLIGEFELGEKPCERVKQAAFELSGVGGRILKAQKFQPGDGCGRGPEEKGNSIKAGRYVVSAAGLGLEDGGYGQRHLAVIEKLRTRKTDDPGGANNAGVSYRRIDPTRYEVFLKGPGIRKIVFNDSYSPGWRIQGKGLSGKPLKVNGYANGFIFEKETGESLVLEYTPQRIYSVSRIISAAALSGVIAAALNLSGRS